MIVRRPNLLRPGLRIGAIVVLVSLFLSACGFKLAGTADLPPQLLSIYLVTDGFSDPQRKALRRSLINAGAELVEQPGAQSAQLNASLKALPDRQVATSARTGVTVKRLSRSLDFYVKDFQGKTIVEPSRLQQQKDASLDNDNLLSSDRERDSVIKDLEQALYDQMIRQLTLI